MLSLAFGQSADAEPGIQGALSGALLCKGDPLQTVRTLARSGSSRFDLGIAAFTYGEEMDEKNILILRSPIVIAGARASAVVHDFATSYDSFHALVYGVFVGDFERVVKELGLRPVPSTSKAVVGQYEKSVETVVNGERQALCPKTIGLTPLREKGKFLLGCGWCNGG